nr:hypothetical protein [Tanacetum cinerariifolium]
MEDVIVECKLFYVSGSETTPNLIFWTLWIKNGKPKLDKRLYPPAVIVIRATNKETKLGDMMRPSAKEIIIPIMNIHHDRELWREDATEFKHQWFSEGVANAIKDKG